MPTPVGRSLVAAVAAVCAVALFPAVATAKPATTWLCKPGLDDNACKTGLETTMLSPAGDPIGSKAPQRSRSRKVDCFYIYPTVSDQVTQNANLDPDPELRSVALYQAGRYSQHCRVYAPVYRQVTLTALNSGGFTPEALEIAYNSVKQGWRAYKRERAPGRGVVLIGHSQGTRMLEQLLAEEIDPKRSARRKLVAAILLGGGVTVEQGGDRGGSFERLRACRSDRQLGCVISFATFNDTVPEDAIFGRTANAGEEVLCTNPGALGGGSGQLHSAYPTEPFAPGSTIGLGNSLIGVPQPDVETPWVEFRGAYSGECSSADGADVLQIQGNSGAPVLTPIPDKTWGLHLVDANIALGNLTTLVKKKARRFVDARG